MFLLGEDDEKKLMLWIHLSFIGVSQSLQFIEFYLVSLHLFVYNKTSICLNMRMCFERYLR